MIHDTVTLYPKTGFSVPPTRAPTQNAEAAVLNRQHTHSLSSPLSCLSNCTRIEKPFGDISAIVLALAAMHLPTVSFLRVVLRVLHGQLCGPGASGSRQLDRMPMEEPLVLACTQEDMSRAPGTARQHTSALRGCLRPRQTSAHALGVILAGGGYTFWQVFTGGWTSS